MSSDCIAQHVERYRLCIRFMEFQFDYTMKDFTFFHTLLSLSLTEPTDKSIITQAAAICEQSRSITMRRIETQKRLESFHSLQPFTSPLPVSSHTLRHPKFSKRILEFQKLSSPLCLSVRTLIEVVSLQPPFNS